MKFTIRDLIWATLVAALLLVTGINWIQMRHQAKRQQDQWEQAVAAEMEARALVERTIKSEEVARVKAKEAQHAQQQLAKQTAQLENQLKHEQHKLSNARTRIKLLEHQLAQKQTANVVYGKSIRSKFPAKCVRIIEGDTIECEDEDNNKLSVRLESIETPERNQPFFQEAKDFTGNLCHAKTVALRVTGKDGYGRTLAFVEVDGKDVSAELLKAGLARHHPGYSNNKTLAGFEQQAKQEKVGVWSVGE